MVMDRLLGEAGPEPDIGGAFLAIALEGIARDRGAEKKQVVEGRQLALRAEAADLIEALIGGTVDLRQDMGRESGGGALPPGIDAHEWLLGA